MNDKKDYIKFDSIDQARQSIHDLLQRALMVELATIPAYSTACYSIQEQGQYNRSSSEIVNAEPIEVIRQVMVEEMLHMVLAANVLNAVGGKPCLTDLEQLPSYPFQFFKEDEFRLHLRSFKPQQIKDFRTVEQAPNPENIANALKGKYKTIAGFYMYVELVLESACEQFAEQEIFCGDENMQVNEQDYYGAGGDVVMVTDLDSAKQALSEIVREGEGAELGETACDGDRIPSPPGEERWDVAHYFKFDGILHSRYYQPWDSINGPPSGGDMVVNWKAVWNMADDPTSTSFESFPDIQKLQNRFNSTYSELLECLEAAFNGEKAMLRNMVPVMFRLKEDAQKLIRIPIPDDEKGRTAGPSWTYLPDRDRD